MLWTEQKVSELTGDHFYIQGDSKDTASVDKTECYRQNNNGMNSGMNWAEE